MLTTLVSACVQYPCTSGDEMRERLAGCNPWRRSAAIGSSPDAWVTSDPPLTEGTFAQGALATWNVGDAAHRSWAVPAPVLDRLIA